MTAPKGYALRQLADGFFEQRPGLVAIFALPFRIEPGGTKLFTERRDIRLVEHQTLGLEFATQIGIQLGRIAALVDRRRVDILGDYGADVFGNFLPGAAIGEEPEA